MTELLSPPQPQLPSVPRRNWRWFAAVAVVAALVAGGIVAGVRYTHWKHSAHTFEVSGSTLISPAVVGRTMYSMVEVNPVDWRAGSARVDLRTATARIVENTADATVRVLICHPNGEPVGYGFPGPPDYCASVRPFRPGVISIGYRFNGEGLLLAVTPHHVGRLRITGLLASYRVGHRDGTQLIGSGLVLNVRAA